MKIDLKTDAEKISEYVRQRIVDYPSQINHGPGEDDAPITQITLGYDVAELGWVALVFDTRSDGAPDGEWRSYIEENWIGFPAWLEAVDRLWVDRDAIELMLPNGRKKELIDDFDFADHVGQMLKDILLNAREQQCFGELPIANKYCIRVENFLISYDWPEFEQRFNDGRIK